MTVPTDRPDIAPPKSTPTAFVGGSARVAATPPGALVILGQPVAQSMSPVFQSAALAHLGLAATYTRRETSPDDLDVALAACRAASIGGNVTHPLKEDVAARATQLTDVARRAGAVNTFWFEDGALIGHNTDVAGVLATFEALVPPGAIDRLVLIGAGGSAAAVLVAAGLRGVGRLSIVARTPARAVELLARVGLEGEVRDPHASAVRDDLANATLVVNSTPVGMRDELVPFDVGLLGEDTAVFDLVYRAAGTRLMHAARARGLNAEDGLRMLVEQGAAAFHAWFGVEPPREVMWSALGVPMPPVRAPRP